MRTAGCGLRGQSGRQGRWPPRGMLWASREEEARGMLWAASRPAQAWPRVPGRLRLMLPFFSPVCLGTLCFWKGRS